MTRAGLADRRIVATTTPYVERHVRLTPSIYNTPDEIERVLAAIGSLSDT